VADINYLAVLCSLGLALGLGALWYSPLMFGRVWCRLKRYTPEQAEKMRGSIWPAYVISIIGYTTMALVIAVLVAVLGLTSASEGMVLGFLLWLGFTFTTGLIANMFSERRFRSFVIDTTYQLACLLIMGSMIGAWR
jgi:hypothetical protein